MIAMTETEYENIADKNLKDLEEEVGGTKIEHKKITVQTN